VTAYSTLCSKFEIQVVTRFRAPRAIVCGTMTFLFDRRRVNIISTSYWFADHHGSYHSVDAGLDGRDMSALSYRRAC